jgi:trans-2,3-dihydro-3-hydroxyanthranilate isomerase
MLCIENNQLIEDAATGSASSCLQLSLKYHTPVIEIIKENLLIGLHKFFMENYGWAFDIKLVEKHNSLQRSGKQNSQRRTR